MYITKLDPKDLSIYKDLLVDEVLHRAPIPLSQKETAKAELQKLSPKELIAELKKYREMRRGRPMPYVLFGFVGKDYQGGNPIPTPRLHRLYCGTCHAQMSAIDNEIGSGKVILDYWFPTIQNIPKKAAQTESGWVLDVRNNEDRFEELAIYVRNKMAQQSGMTEARVARDEANELRLKLAQMQEQLDANNKRDSRAQGKA
jgi:hypothetical protein